MNRQSILNIAEIADQKGVDNIVISPGSRSAFISMAFTRHKGIKTYIIKDERSAGFFALGLAQAVKKTVGIVCTSGTAVLNLYPAIAEAFFQEIPLIIFTADRPTEWIGQNDGQTIFQENVFSKHVKKSYTFPDSIPHNDVIWFGNRVINEAINYTQQFPKGPVHINIPFREPFYPDKDEAFNYDHNSRIINNILPDYQLDNNNWGKLNKQWAQSKRILIVCGQQAYDSNFTNALIRFVSFHNIPVIGDLQANIHDAGDKVITNHDVLLINKKNKKNLIPDLLITIGKSILSKKLKQFLRESPIKNQWHIQEAGTPADSFKKLTEHVQCSPLYFFRNGESELVQNSKIVLYQDMWKRASENAREKYKALIRKSEYSEFKMAEIISVNLPAKCNIHLSNSMPVRLFNFGIKLNKEIEVYSNRGTSGIDGCSSTAVGFTAKSEKLNFLITGDVAFFYDRNAFWNDYVSPNLRIILINNHGGGIFRLIDGPASLPELEDLFETNQPLKAKHTAEEFGFEYFACNNEIELKGILVEFFKMTGTPKILELESNKMINQKVLSEIKAQFI